MKGLIATKIGMSRIFLDSGEAVPVTYLRVDRNHVVRTKTEDKDGYNAVVVGVSPKKWRTRKGKEHTRFATQKEWQVESIDGIAPGAELSCNLLPKDSKVTITGTSKGKGFQGVIKRHGFSRGPETHGSHHHRRPGSIGMKEWPGRVLKGKKLPGRMGPKTVTLHDRLVMECDPEENLLCIKGPVPGPTGSTVFVTVESWPEGFDEGSVLSGGTAESPKEEVKEEPKKEESKVETPKEEETDSPDKAS